jgi:polysaccharide biosynthesis protein PslA
MASFVSTPAAIPGSFDRGDDVSLWRGRYPAPQKQSESASLRTHKGYLYRHHQRRAFREPVSSPAKRAMDIVGASAALIFLAPLLAGIALAIKLGSPGPVLFTQNRYGHRSRLFRVYKFRTMYTDATDVTGVRQTVAGDSRVTPIGRILRLTSFDELPQLINVLRGEMSLVGPRPHVPGMLAGGLLYEELVPYYFQRYTVRPGLTGLAQANGWRGSTTDPGAAITRVDYDLDYIENWSLWLDCKIVLRTVRREFVSGHGI